MRAEEGIDEEPMVGLSGFNLNQQLARFLQKNSASEPSTPINPLDSVMTRSRRW